MNGLHLIADLHECACTPALLLDAAGLEACCTNVCAKHGLTIVGRFFHQFISASGAPAGVTGTVVLAESHLAIHTWPEIKGVTLDIYVCNFSADNSAAARSALHEILAIFHPGRTDSKEVHRGQLQQPVLK